MVQRGDLVTSSLTGEASVAADLEVAYEALKALPSTNALSATLGAVTLSPGVYTQAGAVSITGPLVLDAGGDANAVFVFQLGAALTVAANTGITIVGGGSPQNVYWQVLGAASLGADSRFVGSLLSKAAIASGKDASVLGRLLSIDAAVSLYSNDIDAVASSTSAAASTISQISAEQLSALTFGQASKYAAFSGAAFSNAGTTTVTGDVGSVGALSGATMTQTGSIKTADLASIKADLESLYLATSRLRTTTELSTTVGATTLTPGVYSAAAALTVTGDLILDTGADADAVFVFQVVGALDLPASAEITITGAGSAANVYWQVKGAVALGANSKFVGTVLSKGAVAAGSEATVLGRLISIDAAVALNSNTLDNVSIALAAAAAQAAQAAAAASAAQAALDAAAQARADLAAGIAADALAVLEAADALAALAAADALAVLEAADALAALAAADALAVLEAADALAALAAAGAADLAEDAKDAADAVITANAAAAQAELDALSQENEDAAAAQAELDALAQEKEDAAVAQADDSVNDVAVNVVADLVADDAVNVVADLVADDAVNAVSCVVNAVSWVVSAMSSAMSSAVSAAANALSWVVSSVSSALSAMSAAANSALKSISAISSALNKGL
jgi:hypothetical protein